MKPFNLPYKYRPLLAMAAGACNNDLEEKIYSEVTEESYNYSNAYQAMSIGYATMRNLISHTHYYMAQESTTDAIVMPANASGWDDGGFTSACTCTPGTRRIPQINNMWNTYYSGGGGDQCQPAHRAAYEWENCYSR